MAPLELERDEIINKLLTSECIQRLIQANISYSPKSTESSKEKRKFARAINRLEHHTYLEHEQALILHNNSVAKAPIDSEELAHAYSDRSAFLLHVKKYQECSEDIQRSLQITNSTYLRDKLFQRRIECLHYLQISKSKGENNESIADSKIKDFIGKDENRESLVEIKHNNKYGRHLVATKDIKPGDIIFVEEPFVTFYNIHKQYLYCGFCTSIAWSGIPCDNCDLIVFCSEKCKEEAWIQYHDVECHCIYYVLQFCKDIFIKTGIKTNMDKTSIRALVKGLREFGDWKKLKAELQLIDESSDERTKGFSNGKFPTNQFRSLYSLKVSSTSTKSMESCIITFCSVMLVCLAKYTSFFGGKLKFSNLQELIDNEHVIFIGSLLLRLSKIQALNGDAIVSMHVFSNCPHGSVICKENALCKNCCIKGHCIVPLASLINHSCNPNASKCFTDDMKFIMYALQPIQKGDQIFQSYLSNFYKAPNPSRRNSYKEQYGFNCDCVACEENWPFWPVIETRYEDLPKEIKMKSKEVRILNKYKNLMKCIEKENAPYDLELICRLSNAIEYLSKNLDQPSIITFKVIQALSVVFEKLYGYQCRVFNSC